MDFFLYMGFVLVLNTARSAAALTLSERFVPLLGFFPLIDLLKWCDDSVRWGLDDIRRGLDLSSLSAHQKLGFISLFNLQQQRRSHTYSEILKLKTLALNDWEL